MNEIWNLLSDNPIYSGVCVLLIGFLCKKFFPSFQDKEETTIEINNYIEDKKSYQVKKEEYKNELSISEKNLFGELSILFLDVEKKIALFNSICESDNYLKKLQEFNEWQYKRVEDIRIKIKNDVDVSKNFERVALSLLEGILNTYQLFYSANRLEYKNKIYHIDLYYQYIKEKYDKLQGFKR